MLSCTTVSITGRERIKGLNDYIPTAMAHAKKVNDQVAIQEEQQQNTH